MESDDRLEFLGGAVLGMLVAEELYRANPSLAEGSLTQLRPAPARNEVWEMTVVELHWGTCASFRFS